MTAVSQLRPLSQGTGIGTDIKQRNGFNRSGYRIDLKHGGQSMKHDDMIRKGKLGNETNLKSKTQRIMA